MKEPLVTMLKIYKPLELGVDWMDYKIYRANDLTFHHILEKRNGGDRSIDNGAILVKSAHQYLNKLDEQYHKYYEELNDLFRMLNRTQFPPTADYYEEVHRVLKKVQNRGGKW